MRRVKYIAALLIFLITYGWADASFKGFTISEAITHRNLSLFLIAGEESLKGKVIKTLEQAMEEKKFIVHETGSVNQLQVENLYSEAYVFIQSGDIVKGGKQDRTLQHSMLIPPTSGPVDVASFCVEQGRWSKRGSEDVSQFSGSKNRVVSKELKLAARSKKSQQEVWSEVSNYQGKLKKKLSNRTTTTTTAQTDTATQNEHPVHRMERVQRSEVDPHVLSNVLSVQQRRSNTSLQLSIENEDFKREVTAYKKAIEQKLPSLNGVVGFAFAINGEINSADIYASYDLFKQLWPKVLESTVMEAVVAEDKGESRSVSSLDIAAWFKTVESEKEKSEEINRAVDQNIKESESDVLYEATLKGSKSEWIHKNYIKK